MPYQRILTVQDISCVGQCSITVALPILSACGLEACILPSAVLSTHTGGFTGFTVHDLTDEFPKILRHWKQEQIRFDAVYTGYLCSVRQIDYLEELLQTLLAPNGKVIVDPVMADHGRLYPGFDETYAAGMRRLCRRADVILPNLTEACLLAGKPYCESYTERDISNLLQALRELGPNAAVITGIGYERGMTGIAAAAGSEAFYCPHARYPQIFHGTGDIYTSAFTGAWLQGKSIRDSVRIAADYTLACIENTRDDPQHWYGVKFESALAELIAAVAGEDPS